MFQPSCFHENELAIWSHELTIWGLISHHNKQPNQKIRKCLWIWNILSSAFFFFQVEMHSWSRDEWALQCVCNYLKQSRDNTIQCILLCSKFKQGFSSWPKTFGFSVICLKDASNQSLFGFAAHSGSCNNKHFSEVRPSGWRHLTHSYWEIPQQWQF